MVLFKINDQKSARKYHLFFQKLCVVFVMLCIVYNSIGQESSSLDKHEYDKDLASHKVIVTPHTQVLKSNAELAIPIDSIANTTKAKFVLIEKEKKYKDQFDHKLYSNLPDTTKLRFITENLGNLSATESSLPLAYALKGLALAETIDDEGWIGRMKICLAKIYSDSFEIKLAVTSAEEALAHFTNADLTKEIFYTQRVLANVYTVDLSYDKAMQSCYQVIQMCEAMDDEKLLAEIYLEAARNFTNFVKEEQSNEYAEKARELYQQQNNDEGISQSLFYSCTNYMRLGQWDLALRDINVAINLAKEHPSWGEVKYYHLIQKRGEILGEAARYDEALADIDYVEGMTDGDNRFDFKNWNNHKRSDYYLRMGELNKAKKVCYEIINQPDRDFNRWLDDTYAYLENIYSLENELDSAYHYHMLVHKMRDEERLATSRLNMEQINTQYETKEKEEVIMLQQEQLKQQNIIKWLGFALTGILGLFLIQIYRSTQARRKNTDEMNAMRSRLYTNITHEFRTPLTVILGLSEEILESTEDADIPQSTKNKIKQHHTLIQRNGDNLLSLINQLLDLAKSDNQSLQLNLIQNDIISYINYLTESFYSKAEEKNIRLLFYPELSELVMDYDDTRIQQVVYNLLSNALKFTAENGKIILHANQIIHKGVPTLQLKFTDNGIGIASETLAKIFDRFYQVDDSQTRDVDGSGIGLSFTKECVELMDGEISVDSQLHKGTTFTVLLPIRNEAPFLESARKSAVNTSILYNGESSTAISLAGTLPQDRCIILIVEDNKDVCYYLEQVLSQSYEIISAPNGEIGIQKALELIPDLIISDVMMPVKDGYELTKTLKTDTSTSHIPIILLTAKATQKGKIEGLSRGADAYLNKPFNKKELFIRIKKLIENRNAMQQFYSNPQIHDAVQINTSTDEVYISQENAFINQLKKIIYLHLNNDKLNAEIIANSIGISQSQLYRKIKALTGLTISGYINQLRLHKSIEYIENTEMDIAQIAYEVGFNSPSYYSRSFHKLYNKSPMRYRKSLNSKQF